MGFRALELEHLLLEHRRGIPRSREQNWVGGDGERVRLVYVLGDPALAYPEFWKKAMTSERVRAPLEMQVELRLHLGERQTALANATG